MRLLISVVALLVSIPAAAEADRTCTKKAATWINQNTPSNVYKSAWLAAEFCAQSNAHVDCLPVAKSWLFRNTPASLNEAGLEAIEYCKDVQEVPENDGTSIEGKFADPRS
jgi:hypothetical protein